MKVLFGIMSAVQPAATVGSLADALGTRHPILVHHDWSQQPAFDLARPNLSFVRDPARTGWAVWGFAEGILRLLADGLDRYEFDYFQLLSPSCLPLRPIPEFEAHLARTRADYYMASVSLDDDERARMSHGYRAYADENSLRFRVLRRTRAWMLGDAPAMHNRDGLSFPTGDLRDRQGLIGLRARAALGLLNLAQAGVGFRHPYLDDFRCYAGGTWFTASRRACELAAHRFKRAELDRFARQHMPDEMFFASVFRNSKLVAAPTTHFITRFVDARPQYLTLNDLDGAIASGAFFGRKFPEDPASEVRAEMLRRLGAVNQHPAWRNEAPMVAAT